jgi:ATP-dependent protease ClpP protease subunit
LKQFINFFNREKKKVGYIEFKNKSEDIGEIYVYGEIISGSEKWDDSDVTVTDFKQKLDDLGNVKTLNIFINSPGGSVMAGVNILNILNRHKAIKNVYIDALSASITSVITMCFDNLFIYPTSTIMIHEAMLFMFGVYNKSNLAEEIEILQRIEDNMIIPAYMAKVNDGITEDMIRDAMKKETWMGTNEIKQYFKNVTLIEEEKDIAACCKDFDILNKYQNTPQTIKALVDRNNDYQSNVPNLSSTDNLKAQKLKVELSLL